MGIKKINYNNGTATPDEIAVEYAWRDARGNLIHDTYAKSEDLAPVATSGAYSDLSDFESLPMYNKNREQVLTHTAASGSADPAVQWDTPGSKIYLHRVGISIASYPLIYLDIYCHYANPIKTATTPYPQIGFGTILNDCIICYCRGTTTSGGAGRYVCNILQTNTQSLGQNRLQYYSGSAWNTISPTQIMSDTVTLIQYNNTVW